MSVKCLPRASSSSGLDAGLLTRKSSTGSTIPTPMKWAQTRLANEVANQGFCGDASHLASTTRRSLPLTSGVSPPRNLGGITRPPTGWFDLAAARN